MSPRIKSIDFNGNPVPEVFPLDAKATERVARALVKIESGGMCEYKKVCGLCDCFLKYDPAAVSDRDKYAAANAQTIIDAIKGERA